MLKIFVTVKDHYLKVRPALDSEIQSSPFVWKNELSVQYTDNPDFMMSWTSYLPDLAPKEARALTSLASARYPVAEDFEELESLCPQLIFHHPSNEWVFYGGSFNPWHMGHQSCLDLLPKEKVCVIIPDINPYKEFQSFELVSRILEISSKCRLKNNQFLSPTFLVQNKKNPTIHWVRKLKKLKPELKISLLLGFDSFQSLPDWTEANELLKLLDTLYVASRLETDWAKNNAFKKVQEINPNLQIEYLGHHTNEHLSSTELRRK